jgi:uncharacterized phage protein (TIGR02220 family)
MAQRRMFSKRIINSGKFLKMPISSQALYFHLGINADDDGIVEAYNVVNSIKGCSEDDLRVLVSKGFVEVLNEDLVTYITDWTENNKIRADRKIDSIYKDLLLSINPDIKLIEKRQRADSKPKIVELDNQWTSNGQPMDTIGKDRIGKDRIEKIEDSFPNNNDLLNQIVDYLNTQTGKSFKANSKATQRHILARINEGYSLEDFKAVIDIKVKQWLGDSKMNMYLRPETLFAGHFEGYLNEAPKKKVVEKPKNTNLEKVVDCPWDDPTPEQEAAFDADREAHKYEDGWLINDDGYWINPEKGIV